MSFSRLQQHMARYGYQVIETPILESAELFLTKAGDEIINRLFTFERGGKQLALRPEFTASAAHRYIKGQEEVVRWQFTGMVFEDAPQYQHLSVGAELIGLAGASADAEIIGMAALGLETLGVTEPVRVVIGHVGLMRDLMQSFNLDERTQRFLLNHRSALRNAGQGKAYIVELLNRYLPIQSPVVDLIIEGNQATTEQMLRVLLGDGSRGTVLGGRSRDEIVQRLLTKQQRSSHYDQILAALDFLEVWSQIEETPEQAFERILALVETATTQETLHLWRNTIELIQAYGVAADRIVIKADLERTWDYYTGMVFELWLGDQLVGAGGRYDELTRLLGGQGNTPAVGFTYYMDNLPVDAIREMQSWVLVSKNADGIQWAQSLRQHGLPVRLMPNGTKDAQVMSLSDDGKTLYWNNQAYTSLEHLLTDLNYGY